VVRIDFGWLHSQTSGRRAASTFERITHAQLREPDEGLRRAREVRTGHWVSSARVIRGGPRKARSQVPDDRSVPSELVWLLVGLDKDYGQTSPETPWPEWYAKRIVEELGVAE
jgi:hypothetical protein